MARLLALYPIAVTLLALLLTIAPQRTGILALAQILLPHLFLTVLVLLPPAFLMRDRALVTAVVVASIVGLMRFGSEWASFSPAAGADSDLSVLSWNLEVGARDGAQVVAALRATVADVIALQELTPDTAAAIEADAQLTDRYPHRVLRPDPSVFGMGLLSAHPIAAHEVLADPVGIEAHLDRGAGSIVAVVNAHPLPGRITMGPLGLPIGFDATGRDAALERLRGRIERLMLADEPLVLLGDFNVAPTEPAYRLLSDGLRDAHVEAGQGPGWTWRPSRLEALRIGLLRIDYVFTSATVGTTRTSVDCSRPGDHCLVGASLRLP